MPTPVPPVIARFAITDPVKLAALQVEIEAKKLASASNETMKPNTINVKKDFKSKTFLVHKPTFKIHDVNTNISPVKPLIRAAQSQGLSQRLKQSQGLTPHLKNTTNDVKPRAFSQEARPSDSLQNSLIEESFNK